MHTQKKSRKVNCRRDNFVLKEIDSIADDSRNVFYLHNSHVKMMGDASSRHSFSCFIVLHEGTLINVW